MQTEAIFDVLKQQIYDIFPEWETQGISRADSLKALGANSIDRAEILMMTMSALKLKIPMVTFGKAKNLGELVDTIAANASTQ